MSILELEPKRPPAVAFFLPCVPPTTTHQAKRIARRGRFVRLVDKPELQQASRDLETLLVAHRPAEPLTGPVRLELTFTWPWLKSHSAKVRALGRVRKVTKPDCSNLAKTLEDRLVFLRFLEDDAQVAVLEAQKWHGDQSGITVRLTALSDATSVPERLSGLEQYELPVSATFVHVPPLVVLESARAAPARAPARHTVPPTAPPDAPAAPSAAPTPPTPTT